MNNCNRSRQQGMAIVEFTITLPLLLFLMFAVAEMGRLLYQYNTLTKATEDGARYLAGQVRLAQSQGTLTTATNNAISLVQYGTTQTGQTSLLPGTISVNAITTAPAPNPVIITATYNYNPMILPDKVPGFGLWSDLELTVPMTAQVEMPIL